MGGGCTVSRRPFWMVMREREGRWRHGRILVKPLRSCKTSLLRQRGKIPALALEGALESCLQELAVHNVVMDVEGSVRSHGRRASMR